MILAIVGGFLGGALGFLIISVGPLLFKVFILLGSVILGATLGFIISNDRKGR
jgi:hypothetical protein